MSILFLVPYVPIPRMVKRITTACEISETSVIYWDRGTDVIENINLPKYIREYCIYEKANEGSPLKRIGATIKFSKQGFLILRREKPDCIHVTKTDMLLLVWLYKLTNKKKPKIVYEVSDLHYLALNNSKNIFKILLKKILKIAEYIGCTAVDKLIVTSESFWKVYYKKWIKEDDVVFLPNTPEEKVFVNYKPKDKGRFTIGFIGKVRYKEQIKMMIDAANKCDIDVFIAGNGVDLDEIIDYSKNMKNVEIYGAYNYSKEISNLYQRVDAIYSVYDTSINNVNIALPNRLYEAAICQVPIIAAKGTELGNIVEDEGLGICVRDNDINELVQAIQILREGNSNRSREIYKQFSSKWKYENVNIKLQKIYKMYTQDSII